MDVDYIIVGQGLAGTAVALRLLEKHRKIVVFDDPDQNNSSRIAAGLFNPITGKKMGLTWRADVIFPSLFDYYAEVERKTGQRFFFPTPIYRPFLSIEEQNEWMLKTSEPAYVPYIDRIYTSSYLPALKDPYGGLMLKGCGYLDTSKYIHETRILIARTGTLCNEMFDPQQVELLSDTVRYREISAKKIIWCTGVHGNRFFDWLPVRPLKGETLTINMRLDQDVIVNRGVYLVPAGMDGRWRVGSTYDFKDRTTHITDKARKELELKTSALVNSPFEIEDHQWGFRPTVPDRRPILGLHPEHKQLAVFNGLGTKGISLAPYFSQVLVHWLEKGGSLDREVDIDRFNSVYSASSK